MPASQRRAGQLRPIYYRVIKPERDNWDKFAKIVFWRASVSNARVVSAQWVAHATRRPTAMGRSRYAQADGDGSLTLRAGRRRWVAHATRRPTMGRSRYAQTDGDGGALSNCPLLLSPIARIYVTVSHAASDIMLQLSMSLWYSCCQI